MVVGMSAAPVLTKVAVAVPAAYVLIRVALFSGAAAARLIGRFLPMTLQPTGHRRWAFFRATTEAT